MIHWVWLILAASAGGAIGFMTCALFSINNRWEDV